MTTTDSVLEVGGKTITQANVIARLKITGVFAETALGLARDAAAAAAAGDLEVSIPDEELQAAYDDFRRECNMLGASETEAWLEQSGLTIEDVEAYLEAGLLRQKLAKELISDEKIDSYFAQNPSEFDYAKVSHIVVGDKNAAEELSLSLKEEGEDFAALARTHSIDKATSCGGGFRGLVTRDDTLDLPEDVADRIFSAAAGDIVGPFESNGSSCLVRVEESGRLPLDDSLRDRIRSTLCEELLAEKSDI